MGSLQDELKTKLANLEFVTPKRDEGFGIREVPKPPPDQSIVEQQKLAGITPNPVPQFGTLADYAAAVTRLCEQDVMTVQALVAGLDRYSPSVNEPKYKALKIEVKQLHERLVQARRLAAAISK